MKCVEAVDVFIEEGSASAWPAVVVVVIVLVVAAIIVVVYYRRRRRRQMTTTIEDVENLKAHEWYVSTLTVNFNSLYCF